MQMTVCPGHRDLNDVVQPVEFRVRSDEYTPPDRRLRPLERDLKLIEWDAAAGLNVRNALHEWHAMRCVAVGQLLSEPVCSPGFSRSPAVCSPAQRKCLLRTSARRAKPGGTEP